MEKLFCLNRGKGDRRGGKVVFLVEKEFCGFIVCVCVRGFTVDKGSTHGFFFPFPKSCSCSEWTWNL